MIKLADANLDGAFTDLQQALELAQTDRVRFYGQIYLWMILAQQNRAAEANQRLTDYLQSNQLRNSQ